MRRFPLVVVMILLVGGVLTGSLWMVQRAAREALREVRRTRRRLGGSGEMAPWRKRLFSFLSRNARPASDFFGLPVNRVVEMGAQIKL